jgi:hypothetical protein
MALRITTIALSGYISYYTKCFPGTLPRTRVEAKARAGRKPRGDGGANNAPAATTDEEET